MRRRTIMSRSSGSATRAKMDASVAFLVLFVAGSTVGYSMRREASYNAIPSGSNTIRSQNQVYQVMDEPSQRLFWGNQGSNSVGGTGLWSHLTNKYPALGNLFGRMEQNPQYAFQPQTQYGVPQAQYGVPSMLYGSPYQTQYQNQLQYYQQPLSYQQPQFYQVPFGQQFAPSATGRDVGFTDDAVIVTPPFVPISQPQPAPVPAPVPAPAPVPVDVDQGYQYNKPQYRLELPQK